MRYTLEIDIDENVPTKADLVERILIVAARMTPGSQELIQHTDHDVNVWDAGGQPVGKWRIECGIVKDTEKLGDSLRKMVQG